VSSLGEEHSKSPSKEQLLKKLNVPFDLGWRWCGREKGVGEEEELLKCA
jgi:hypothetical protein